jgi:pimeloyl-ACP methyl ester carboxylesterase
LSDPGTSEHIVVFDGRKLAVDVAGDPEGEPVILMHGSPGSKRGPRPRDSVLYRLGVRLISYDRPGYGGSNRDLKRTVADAAADVEAIANDLKIDRFAVVGRSGGGPHALAAAALLPARVTRAAVLVGIAPQAQDIDDWVEGMTWSNVRDHRAVDKEFVTLIERLMMRADRTISDPKSFLRELRKQMTGPDRHIVSDVVMEQLLTQSYVEAFRAGPAGWIDDVYAFNQPWGFEIEYVQPPVLLWHGVEDNFSPVNHSRWLADRLPNAEKAFEPNMAHFGAIEILPAVLPWLTGAEAFTG